MGTLLKNKQYKSPKQSANLNQKVKAAKQFFSVSLIDTFESGTFCPLFAGGI